MRFLVGTILRDTAGSNSWEYRNIGKHCSSSTKYDCFHLLATATHFLLGSWHSRRITPILFPGSIQGGYLSANRFAIYQVRMVGLLLPPPPIAYLHSGEKWWEVLWDTAMVNLYSQCFPGVASWRPEILPTRPFIAEDPVIYRTASLSNSFTHPSKGSCRCQPAKG